MKERYFVEGHSGFRWLKGAPGAAPKSLNTPKRIAALGQVFILAFIVGNYIQHVARAGLVALPGELFLRKPSVIASSRG